MQDEPQPREPAPPAEPITGTEDTDVPAQPAADLARSIDEERESLRRALRELEASEARVRRHAERVYDESRAKLVLELLPVLDNLDRTIEAAVRSSDRALVEGVRMVRAQLEAVLVRYGAERIDAAGQRFDPAIHEAISAQPVADPRMAGLVLQQLQPGYRYGDRLLRAAKVLVGVHRAHG